MYILSCIRYDLDSWPQQYISVDIPRKSGPRSLLRGVRDKLIELNMEILPKEGKVTRLGGNRDDDSESDARVVAQLSKLECSLEPRCYTFGVLYIKEGQVSESVIGNIKSSGNKDDIKDIENTEIIEIVGYIRLPPPTPLPSFCVLFSSFCYSPIVRLHISLNAVHLLASLALIFLVSFSPMHTL